MPWSVLGNSVVGTSHRARNAPCQDAYRYHTFGAIGEWLMIVTADGAGSASRAEIGARLACDEFVRLVTALKPQIPSNLEAMMSVFNGVRTALVDEAERLEVRPRELACTALLAIVGPESSTFAQLGDGAIVIGDGQAHRTVFWPEPSEYANATDFLTDDRGNELIRFETITEPVVEVAVFTDGLQRLALDFTSCTAYSGFFRPLFKEMRAALDPESLVEPLREFLDSEQVNQRTDDDKTIVLAVRRV